MPISNPSTRAEGYSTSTIRSVVPNDRSYAADSAVVPMSVRMRPLAQLFPPTGSLRYVKNASGNLALGVAALFTGLLVVGCGTTQTHVGATSDTGLSADARSEPPHPPTASESFDPGRSRVAQLFVDFARREGAADGPPVDTPVALYLGNAYQRTIPDGKSDVRAQWQVCDEYGQHACPMSALEVLADSPGEVAMSDSVTSACLETLAKPPSETGGPHQVVLSPPEPRTCSDDYAVQIWINDVGQITAVNLLLGSGS